MAITSLDTYTAAVKQWITYNKTTSKTAVAAIPFSVMDMPGTPSSAAVALGSSASGIVPTDATAGYPPVTDFVTAGYLGKIDYAWTVPGRLHLYDVLFTAGSYNFNSDITLSTPPSFSARVPSANYNGLELWLEAVTAHTGNQTINIDYLDQDGQAGNTTVATGVAPIIGRMLRLPLAAGDSGISGLVRVRSSVSTVGTFNVHIMRQLWTGRIPVANSGDTHSFARTGLKPVYGTSALRLICQPDSTATALPQLYVELCDG